MLNKLKPTIAVVDSGIGGVSVLKQLIQKYHAGNYIYFADNLYMPYGKKSATFLKNRVENIIENLNKFYQPDIIFIACNTASSVLKNKLKNVKTIDFKTDTPILATKLTSQQLTGFNVIAAKNLATQIEKHINNLPVLNKYIKHLVENLKLNQYKSITLGCTHYELVKDLFTKQCQNTQFLLNSSRMIESVKFKPKQGQKTIKIILSKKDEKYEKRILNLINE